MLIMRETFLIFDIDLVDSVRSTKSFQVHRFSIIKILLAGRGVALISISLFMKLRLPAITKLIA